MDVNSLIQSFSTLDLDSPYTAEVEVTASTRDAQVNTSLDGHSPTPSSDTAAATPSLVGTPLPPQASLLSLPHELKDMIYGYLTEDEDRIILGWRFVEAYKRHWPALSYEDRFTSAIALRPLSMTCKQMLTEFQPALLQATKTRWTFSVNNFDLEQLQAFSDYINTGTSVKLTDRLWASAAQSKPCSCSPFMYDVELRLRFQMDNNAVSSFVKLRDIHLSTDPDGHNYIRSFHFLESADTQVETRYHPGTSASVNHIQVMAKEEASLRSEIWISNS